MASRTLGKFVYSRIQTNTLRNIRSVGSVLRLYSTPATGTQGKAFIRLF